MRLQVTAAAGAVAVLVASAVWTVSAGAAPRCTALQIRSGGPGAVSALYRVDLPAAESTRLGVLDDRLNALGYAASQGAVYGMAARGPSGPFPDGAHAVTLEPSGQIRDLGRVRGGPVPLWSPKAGAVKGNRWYVAEWGYLYTVDINPRSSGYLRVSSATTIDPWAWPLGLDDFDVDPEDGELYGVTTTYLDKAAVVRIDRDSGRITKIADVHGLPPGEYGSVVIGPDRALYVSSDGFGGWYRVGRDGSVARLGGGSPAWSSDAAGCLAEAPEPPRPPTPTPTTTRPIPSPYPSPAPPSRMPPPSPSSMPPPPPPLPPPPPPEADEENPPTQEPDSDETGHDTKEKRRWALATLLLLIGGSAAARRLR